MKQLTIMSDFKKKKDPNMDGLKKTWQRYRDTFEGTTWEENIWC